MERQSGDTGRTVNIFSYFEISGVAVRSIHQNSEK